MTFEWDPAKARANLAKHKVSFELASRVWDDPNCVFVQDRFVDGQQRWHAIGIVGTHTLLLVVHIYPNPATDERIRIISARKATPHERRRYEEEAP